MAKKPKHAMAGFPVKVEEGTYKGQYFKVIDYLVNQYQGKDMEKIAVSKASLVTPVIGRGYPLDDNIVFGQLYPAMTFMCMHDDELKVKTAKPPLKIVENEEAKENEDDSGTTSTGDNQPSSTGESESDGRSVPSSTRAKTSKRSNKSEG